MDDLRRPAQRASPRTVAIVAVAALIAIAVAGITMAVLRGRPQAGDAVTSTAASGARAGASRTARAPGDVNRIVFAADSDQLSPEAVDQIKDMAESTRTATTPLVLSGKIEAASDRAARMELAKKRINAMRRALQSAGVSPTRLRVEIAEYPVGRVPPRDADVIEMNLRQ